MKHQPKNELRRAYACLGWFITHDRYAREPRNRSERVAVQETMDIIGYVMQLEPKLGFGTLWLHNRSL